MKDAPKPIMSEEKSEGGACGIDTGIQDVANPMGAKKNRKKRSRSGRSAQQKDEKRGYNRGEGGY